MSIIAEFTVPAEQFALHETLTTVPGVVVEVERVVAHGPGQIMPYFWVSSEDYNEFETVAKNDPSIQDLTQLDTVEDTVLYQAHWTQDVEAIVYAYTKIGGILLDATGRDKQWEVKLRFDNEDDIAQFNDYLDENDLTANLTRLSHASKPIVESTPPLTQTQRETVIAGLQAGYYEIPRETRPSELAEEFGISQQALSKRFRRAHRALVENTYAITPPENE